MAKIVQVAIRDGLMPNMFSELGFVSPSAYMMRFWGEVPDDWCDGGTVRDDKKAFLLNQIQHGLYARHVPEGDWRSGNPDGSLFVVLSEQVDVLGDPEAAARPWKSQEEGFRNWSCFVIAEGGRFQVVNCQDFVPNLLSRPADSRTG